MRHPVYERAQSLVALWFILPTTLTVASVSVMRAGGDDALVALVILCAVHAGLLAVFGRLLVQLDSQALEWRFGWLPWPHWRVPLDQIVNVEVVRTRWHEGWGIRFTSQGRLYNAHGLGAVQLQLRDGRRVRLGSPEPERLAGFVRARLAQSGSSAAPASLRR